MKNVFKICLVLALLGAMPLLAGPARAGPDADPDTVTVQLKWKHQFQFAGYYIAIEKGYYADAGMDVRLIEAVAGQEPMNEVVDGRADYGVGTTDLLLMRDKGLPVVLLASIFQHSPLAIMVNGTSDIFNVHQLARKKLMIEPHSAELFAYFSKEGINKDSLKIVEHNFDTDALLQGDVSGMSVYITDEPYRLKSSGSRYRLLRPIESGIDFYGDNLFTLESTIQKNPKQVDRFVAATRKGWEYALNNIEETVDLILQKYATDKSRGHLLFEAEHTKSLILPDVVEVGYMNPQRWERIAQTYIDLGLLPETFSLHGLIYNPESSQVPAWVWKAIAIAVIVLLITLGVVVYVMRINHRLRLSEKQLVASNHQKETLMSIVGHDMKSSIFAVRLYGELMVNQKASLDQKDISKHGLQVLLGIDAALDLLDNLLQWVTLQQKDSEPGISPLELAPVVERNLALYRLHAESKNIDMRAIDIGDVIVLGNEWHIDTVIRNLLNNALKFTKPDGSISIRVERGDGDLGLIVEDTGIGMNEEDLEDPFDTRRQFGTGTMGELGTGFGLPLCNQLIESSGGQLMLENRAEVGLRATIRLPLAKPEKMESFANVVLR